MSPRALFTALATAIATACSQTGLPAGPQDNDEPPSPQASALAPEPSPEMTEPQDPKPERPEASENASDPGRNAAMRLPGTAQPDLTGVWHHSESPGTHLEFMAGPKGTSSGPIHLTGAWSYTANPPSHWIALPNGTVTLIDETGAPVWTGSLAPGDPSEVRSSDGPAVLTRPQN